MQTGSCIAPAQSKPTTKYLGSVPVWHREGIGADGAVASVVLPTDGKGAQEE